MATLSQGLVIKEGFPCGYFDGVAVQSQGGTRVFIVISSIHSLAFKLGCGPSTNTRAELLELWTPLFVSFKVGIPLKKIYGDSSVIINWTNKKAALSSIDLNLWCDNVRYLILSFSSLDIVHVYREHNQKTYCLSKDALVLASILYSYS